MAALINLDDAVMREVDAGEAVVLGVVFYSVKENALRIQPVSTISAEEVQGILSKFNLKNAYVGPGNA